MYAILDIETTGGQFNEEGITEIAIYKFDGHEVVDQFISLVNPEIPIQPFVVKLTGINNAMLRSAPKFFEIAKRIIEITQDCVIVAHNAAFDYRILKTEFRRLGYNFEARTLCTVELAQKLLPEQLSYSLGKLVRALGIPMADRHRANGDALATVKLFKMLLEKDLEKTIVKDFIKLEVEKGIAPKLLDIIDSIPSKTGVYYIHNEKGNLIYIGKSRNMKKSVNQVFVKTSSKYKKIQNEVFSVTFDETGNELIATLKETQEIKINKPIFNSIPKKNIFKWAIYSDKNADGYITLKLQKADGRKKEVLSFTTFLEGQNMLLKVTSEFNLCQKLTGLYVTEKHCSQYKTGECDGACIKKISSEEYNERVQQFINENLFENKSMIVVDRGRNINERSGILIEKGVFKGYCFYDLNYQINNLDILKNILIPMPDSREAKNIIQSYLRKQKSPKIIDLGNEK